MTHALIILAIVGLVLVVGAVKVFLSIAKREIRRHGGHLVWWFFSGHHYGGARDCCRGGHCPPAVRWRRVRRRIMPFLLILTTVLAVILLGSWMLAVPAGLLAALVTLYPRRAHRVGRVLISPVTSRVSIPTPSMPAISAPQWASRAIAPAGELAAVAQRQRDTNRYVIGPMAPALGPLLGMPAANTRKIITLNPGYLTAKDGEIGAIGPLPPAFRATPDERRAVEHLISSRLPVDADFSWRTHQFPQRVALLAAPQCPPRVMLADMLADMKSCKRGEVLLGADRKEDPFHGSFLIDDPHWGFSVSSCRGKSMFLQITAAQILHQDPEATVDGIDPKMGSLTGLIGIPGVTIANDPRTLGEWDRETQRCYGGMWGLIDDFRAVMMERLEAITADPTIAFPLKLFILDEANQFSEMTSAAWRVQRKAKEGDPPTPPPWSSLAAIHWMGRIAGCHVATVGQRLDDKATGGIGLRSAMGFVGIAGYRVKEWDLLIGTRPMPRSQKPKGRWLYDDGSTQTWVQNLCASLNPAEAGIVIREYASEGRRQGPVPDRVPVEGVPAGSPALTAPVGTGGTGTNAAWIVGIEAGAAVLEVAPETFKKRRQRSGGTIPGEVRQGNRPAWTEADLIAWVDQDAVKAISERN